MKYSQVGEFLKQQRVKYNLSQEELAETLHVTRQAISSWENGKNLPGIEQLANLANLYKLSIAELIAGEEIKDKEKENEIIYETVENEKKKYKKIIKIFITIFTFLIVAFLIYYFTNSYKSTKVYTISMIEDKIPINGLMITSKEQTYFTLTIEDIEIEYLTLIYNDKEIYKTEDKRVFFRDYYGYNAYIIDGNINNFINNLFLKITTKEKEYKIKLDLQKDFENDSILFLKKKKISTGTPRELDIKVPQKIIDNFIYKDNCYQLQIPKEKYTAYLAYVPEAYLLLVGEIYENKSLEWYYYGRNKYLIYDEVDSNGNTVNRFSDNIKEDSKEDFIIYFKENYLKKYIEE